MQLPVSYNEFLYQKRMEKKLSKKKFAKFLKIPPLFYSYFERGYVKPSKRYVKKISEALGIDFSVYLDGLSSYPTPLPENDGRFVKFSKKLFSKLWVRFTFLGLLLASLGVCIGGFISYNHTMSHADSFFNERYLAFSYAMREKGGMTFSLLHEMTRPEIHLSDGTKYISISTSSENYALRSLTAYANYTTDDYSLYYIIPNDAQLELKQVKVQYTDKSTLIKYSSLFTREDLKSAFELSSNIYDDQGAEVKDENLCRNLSKVFSLHIGELNKEFTALIKEKLDLDYDFYTELLIDHSQSATNNLYSEIVSLAVGFGGMIFTGGFLFFILFAIFFSDKRIKKRKRKGEKEAISASVVEDDVAIERGKRTPKKDFWFFPFIPETFFELLGIVLVFFGSLRILYYTVMLFSAFAITPSDFNSLNLSLFMYFTVGMFLLYFMDFDIFLSDKRSLRNFFLYGIIFIGLYIIEGTLVEYLDKTRGIIQIIDLLYIVPNNFGTISCYFGIMVFLFYTPEWMKKSKAGAVLFRCASLLPLSWIFVSSLVFQNYKTWGIEFNTWQLYFFNSERPQFSILCCSYLVGLYFLRMFFRKLYGEEKAARFFNGNKFYFLKNILVCLIIVSLSLAEYFLANQNRGLKTLGGYWEIIYLVPLLLFYHPHIGKRSKPLDYFTLILYAIFFGMGYVIAALVVISFVFAR